MVSFCKTPLIFITGLKLNWLSMISTFWRKTSNCSSIVTLPFTLGHPPSANFGSLLLRLPVILVSLTLNSPHPLHPSTDITPLPLPLPRQNVKTIVTHLLLYLIITSPSTSVISPFPFPRQNAKNIDTLLLLHPNIVSPLLHPPWSSAIDPAILLFIRSLIFPIAPLRAVLSVFSPTARPH